VRRGRTGALDRHIPTEHLIDTARQTCPIPP
jgi:hypothetical protein